MVDEELRAALDEIEAQWNAAEEYVKKVERLRRGLVVGAAINELRYAGRRLVEAYAAAKEAANNPKRRQDAFDLLREVRHFCLRAQHDAIDGAVTYIDQALFKFETEFGADLLNAQFPNYMSMKAGLRDISQIMARSRGDRDSREALYGEIRDGLVPTLIDQHYEIETSKGVLIAAYERRVATEKKDTGRFWLMVAIAVVTAIAAIAALKPILFP